MLLTSNPEPIARVIAATADTWLTTAQRPETIELDCDFYVSYNYQYIVRGGVLERIMDRFVNIHISLLPWNRGSYPNFWSWYDDTPKGVTIHQVDSGIDTGPILSQTSVTLKSDGTLRTTWDQLQSAAVHCFQRSWLAIRSGDLVPVAQSGTATFHTDAEMAAMWAFFPLRYDTPVAEVQRAGELARRRPAYLRPDPLM